MLGPGLQKGRGMVPEEDPEFRSRRPDFGAPTRRCQGGRRTHGSELRAGQAGAINGLMRWILKPCVWVEAPTAVTGQ